MSVFIGPTAAARTGPDDYPLAQYMEHFCRLSNRPGSVVHGANLGHTFPFHTETDWANRGLYQEVQKFISNTGFDLYSSNTLEMFSGSVTSNESYILLPTQQKMSA